MIHPRLIGRTHYQVHEPAYLITLIQKCSSPTKSDYRDTVADRFVDQLRTDGILMNAPAARYAVDLGRALGLLTKNNVWTDLAHTVNILSEEINNLPNCLLSFSEQLLFFRIFLEYDGAAFVYFARKFLDREISSIPNNLWVQVANDLFSSVFREYLNLPLDIPSKIRIRHKLEQRRNKPFSGKSGAHQVMIHLQTLYRLGLIEKGERTNKNNYYVDDQELETGPLAILIREIPNIQSLERVVSGRNMLSIAAKVYKHQLHNNAQHQNTGISIEEDVTSIYDRVVSTGANLCPLSTLEDVIDIRRIIRGAPVLHRQGILNGLRKMQNEQPRSIRLHVDRSGNPAFLKM